MKEISTISFSLFDINLRLFATDTALLRINFTDKISDTDQQWLSKFLGPVRLEEEANAILRQARQELEEYSQDRRKEFTVPIALHGTDFQRSVWQELQKIPFGTLISYQNISDALSSSARAVGNANGKNPLSIIVPCHRVVAGNGALQGYAGGLDMKEKLIRHEKAWHLINDISKHQKLF